MKNNTPIIFPIKDLIQEIKNYLLEDLYFWQDNALPNFPQTIAKPHSIKTKTQHITKQNLTLPSEEKTSNIDQPIIEKSVHKKEINLAVSPQQSNKKASTTSTQWPLYPMVCDNITFVDYPLFSKVLSPQCSHIFFQFHILLISPSSLEQLFFENVARGITRLISPTKLLIHTHLTTAKKKLPRDTVLLCPLNELHATFPEVSLHEQFSHEEINFLTIATAQMYTENPSLKRSLWNILKIIHSLTLLKS